MNSSIIEARTNLDAPATRSAAVDISSTDFDVSAVFGGASTGIFVGTGGNLIVRLLGDSTDRTFKVADGQLLPIRVTKVVKTNTTATGIVALCY